jgi:hypothetical protein
MKINNKFIPNTNITLKQFKELLYNKFKVYPIMQTNYKDNTFIITDSFDVTQRKLSSFCNKLGIKHKKYIKRIIIDLN